MCVPRVMCSESVFAPWGLTPCRRERDTPSAPTSGDAVVRHDTVQATDVRRGASIPSGVGVGAVVCGGGPQWQRGSHGRPRRCPTRTWLYKSVSKFATAGGVRSRRRSWGRCPCPGHAASPAPLCQLLPAYAGVCCQDDGASMATWAQRRQRPSGAYLDVRTGAPAYLLPREGSQALRAPPSMTDSIRPGMWDLSRAQHGRRGLRFPAAQPARALPGYRDFARCRLAT